MGGPDVASLRIALLGDGAWAAQSLTALQETPHQVAAVILRVSPSDDTLETAARGLGVPVLRPARVNDPAFQRELRGMAPDLLVSIAYNQILRAEIRGIAAHGALNVHAGKLPFYRGRNVINWAIINGEKEIGLTAHFMDDGIDTGDILLQRTLPIAWTDSYATVLARVVAAVPGLVLESVALVARGGFVVRSQAGLAGTYFGARGDGDEWLDWSAGSASLHNKVRAITSPGPGARTALDGETVLVWRAFFDPAWPRYVATPGQVVGRAGNGALVKTGDSTLLLQEIGLGGARMVPDWPIGTRLTVNAAAALSERLAQLERRMLLEAGS